MVRIRRSYLALLEHYRDVCVPFRLEDFCIQITGHGWIGRGLYLFAAFSVSKLEC